MVRTGGSVISERAAQRRRGGLPSVALKVALTAAAVLLSCRPAHAYVDPGTFTNLFFSIGPIIGVLLAGLGVVIWPFRWALVSAYCWAKRRPALCAVGRGIAWVFRPVLRLLWRVMWPIRALASASRRGLQSRRRRAFMASGVTAVAAASFGTWWFLLQGRKPVAAPSRKRVRRVIVLGVDGLDPNILEAMMGSGELPAFRRLSAKGGFARLATSTPAHSPNAWTCIATGADAGEHGVFDFIQRDPESYRLDLAIIRPNRKNTLGRREKMFLPVRACPAFWETVSEAGIPATVVRWPVTFSPDKVSGNALSGLGVPDIKGGLGTYTFYTTLPPAENEEGKEKVVVVEPKFDGDSGVVETFITGPQVAGFTGRRESRVPLKIVIGRDADRVTLLIDGKSRELAVGEWCEHVKLRFKTGPLARVAGLASFCLKSVKPRLELYLSPIEVDPSDPAFPITAPDGYAKELAEAIGPYHSLGMPEDTKAVTEGRIDADAFLHLCDRISAEREAMLLHELGRFDEGLLALVADTSDRLQHMFWVTRDPEHPLHDAAFARKYAHVIPDVYRHADRLLGHVLERADERTDVLVLSDHGFAAFRRAVHLNTWLAEKGFMNLSETPGDPEGGALFRNVLWEATSCYALGFGGIYVNLAGREGKGVIEEGSERRAVCQRVAEGLCEMRDPGTGGRVVRRVYLRDEIFHGPLADRGPDLVVGFEPGYRASWQTALGGAPAGLVADNRRLWSGDHIVDPTAVPGVILANRPLKRPAARQADVAPTVLSALGLSRTPEMTGKPLT